MVKNMEKEFIIIKMVMYIQDGLHLEKNKVKELIYSILLVKEYYRHFNTPPPPPTTTSSSN